MEHKLHSELLSEIQKGYSNLFKDYKDQPYDDILNTLMKSDDAIDGLNQFLHGGFRKFLDQSFFTIVKFVNDKFILSANHTTYTFTLNYYSENYEDDRVLFDINEYESFAVEFNLIKPNESKIVKIINEYFKNLKKNIDSEKTVHNDKRELFSMKYLFESSKYIRKTIVIDEPPYERSFPDYVMKFIDNKSEHIHIKERIEESKEERYRSLLNSFFNEDKHFKMYSFPVRNILEDRLLANFIILQRSNDGIGATIKLNNTNLEDIQNLLNSIFPFLWSMENKILLAVNQKVKERELIKSSIAAIMSRNMSHNLGSHVLTNTKNQVLKIADKSFGEARAEYLGLSTLLHYIQERQDFIAVITGEDRYAKSGVNFKAHVFDFIAYDGPARRHRSSTTPQQRNFLLDNIIRSENFGRDKIELCLEIQDDEGQFQKLRSTTTSSTSLLFDNILISIPYGVNGRQAFLSILENILRNSAKHFKESLGKGALEITIRFLLRKDNKYQICIYDNKNNYDQVINHFIAKKLVERKNELETIWILPGELNLIDESGTFGRNNKGLKEILLCIAWLKGEDNYLNISNKPNDYFEFVKIDSNFGIQFTLDKFSKFEYLDYNSVENPKDLSAELYITHNNEDKKIYQKKYPRLITGDYFKDSTFDEEKAYAEIISKRFGKEALDYKILIVDANIGDKKHTGNYILSSDTDIDISRNPIERELHLSWRKSKATQLVNLIEGLNYEEAEDILFRYDKSESAEKYTPDINSFIKKVPDQNKFIFFKNHYETVGEEKTFIKISAESKCKFIEGISGGNYTNSLIRSALFNTLHAYRLIEAALTKILIVDERLYKWYNSGTAKSIPLLSEKELIQFVDVLHLSEWHKLKGDYFAFLKIIREIKNEPELIFTKSEIEVIQKNENVDQVINTIKQFERVHSGSRKNWDDYFSGKNICIANFDIEEDKLKYIGKQMPLVQYTFISIHYGLIEKYRDQLSTEIRITLNEALDKMINLIVKKDENVYLSVHSGRGDLNNFVEGEKKINGKTFSFTKPTFIPLAGLDWALSNCKYILSEMFYNQRYTNGPYVKEVLP